MNRLKHLAPLLTALGCVFAGLILLFLLPKPAKSLHSMLYTDIGTESNLSFTDFYPLGELGGETNGGIEYTYYVVAASDSSGTNYLITLKSASQKLRGLIEGQAASRFDGTLFGSTVNPADDVSAAFVEMLEEQKLTDKYRCVYFCFVDSGENHTGEAIIKILSAIAFFGAAVFFSHKFKGSLKSQKKRGLFPD